MCVTYADVLVVFGTNGKETDIADDFNTFGVSAYNILTFFHAFAGCDTISRFYKVRKAKL